MKLSKEQSDIITNCISGLKNKKKRIVITGLAGTGKSVTTNALANELELLGYRVLTLAPTGKSANVLRIKGREAQTIHHVVYDFKGIYTSYNDKEIPIFQIKGLKNIKEVDILIVDESSMVTTKMKKDIESRFNQVIWVGDHGQLEPIGANPKLFETPDYVLNTIFRQKKGSGIINSAHGARATGEIEENEDVLVSGDWKEILNNKRIDQVICGFNKSRVEINSWIRKKDGRTNLIEIGDKLICLKNNYEFSLYNGMGLQVEDIHYSTNRSTYITALTDTDEELTFPVIHSGFDNGSIQEKDLRFDEVVADYGYAITCHKAIGSEWNNVLLLNQSFHRWDHSKWIYTGLTRAKEKSYVIE